MTTIRAELRKLETILNDDIEEFNRKLNSTREDICNYIQRQIQHLLNVEKEYKQQFNYLDEENQKTCQDNRQQFDKLCLSINQNDNNPIIIQKLLKDFQQTFPMRPTMLKSIPEYSFKEIHVNNFILKQKTNKNKFEDKILTLPTNDHNSFSPMTNDQLLIENNEQDKHFNVYTNNQSELLCSSNRSSPVKEHSFIPVKTSTADDTQISSIVSGSMGFSYHKQLASQNNEIGIEPQSRVVSTCSTINESNNMMIDLQFKIPHQHNRKPHLISYHENENCLLIYLLFSHQLEYLCLNPRQISFINLPSNEHLLNLGYSTNYNLFYFSNRQTKNFVLFRLNQQQIEFEQEINLIRNDDDNLISVHMYENFVFFIYISSSIVMLGKYDMEKSSFMSPFSFEDRLYDDVEQSQYDIIDFAINNFYISFLVHLKNKKKFMIVTHDSASMDRLYSFDLIDASQPLSIISIDKKLKSTAKTTCNNQIELLLFVNDPKSHLIHCCTHQQYLIPIQVNAFGICPLNDGNLALVGSRDIRGLKIQDYLQENNVHFD
ncbi:unnamed protein product [Rotaria sordida]|uniref:Uncharacterized protein n=1 Tax=Rotaria sordida TaxID=392033 RepID=A0A818PY11_9BILA|nr:unnamed protein product [Rotaria sordida]